jgi:hypothetical protein
MFLHRTQPLEVLGMVCHRHPTRSVSDDAVRLTVDAGGEGEREVAAVVRAVPMHVNVSRMPDYLAYDDGVWRWCAWSTTSCTSSAVPAQFQPNFLFCFARSSNERLCERAIYFNHESTVPLHTPP